jgi:hypothetical protein
MTDTPSDFVATGTYYDRLVRTPDGWRFEYRRGELDLADELTRDGLGVEMPER